MLLIQGFLTRGGRACLRQHRQYRLTSTAGSSNANNSSPSSDRLKSYLDGWVGLPHPSSSSTNANDPNDNSPVLRARAAMAQGPLLLSGSSYLLPTLRLEQNESPESLKTRLEQASGGNIYLNSNQQWCCPIALDASALAPDGSPHYVPPLPGALNQMVTVLGKYGMQVIGITAGSRQLSASLQEEAAQSGIPSVWSPRKAGTDPRFDVSQVLQLVQQKQILKLQEEQQNSAEESKENSADTKLTAEDEEISMRTFDDKITDVGAAALGSVGQDENSDTNLEDLAGDAEEMEKSVVANPEPEEATTDWSKLKVVELRAEMKSRGLPTTGKKADLVAKLEEYDRTTKVGTTTMPAPIEFSSTSTLYHGSVRSGQQVMSTKGQSLVILGSVNSGGEVLSDGDIFVFGKLRGRAFAGLGCNNPRELSGSSRDDEMESTASARIVATSFDAELVSIGESYTTIDKVEDLNERVALKAGQPIMATLVDNNSTDGAAQSLEFVPVEL